MSVKDIAATDNSDSAHSEDTAKAWPLLGRKSVLMGMLTSGFVIANAAHSSSAVASGTTKPSAIAATPSTTAPRWAPSTAYVYGQQVISPNNDVVSAKLAHQSATAYVTDTAKWALSPTYVEQGRMQMDLAAQPGVDNTGNTECGAAVQTALNSCAALGIRAFANGTFKTASTLTITAPVDLTDLTVKYSGHGTAVLVGTTSTSTAFGDPGGIGSIRLPKLVATAKTTTGWSQVAGTIGVQISNLYNTDIYIPRVNAFETGLKFYGASLGVCYNSIFLGELENNKINCSFNNDSAGWCNSNYIFGGRMSHESAEGTLVSGTRHVLIATCTNPVNTNSFYGTSMESANVVQYHIEASGHDNTWYSCRFENDVTPNVWVRAASNRNSIVYGYSAGLVQTVESGGSLFNILSGTSSTFTNGDDANPVMRLQQDGSSGYPSLVITAASETGDPTVKYGTKLTAWTGRWKTPTNTNDAIVIDGSAPSISLGDGASAPDVSLTRTAAKVLALGATNVFKTGQSATASRPNAASVGVGAQFYDTTLHKPIWSDGVTWRDASGAST
jgi:hypothetical protein